MFNPFLGEWDDDILAFVAGEEGQAGVEKLADLLGEPSTDGGKAASFFFHGAQVHDFTSDMYNS